MTDDVVHTIRTAAVFGAVWYLFSLFAPFQYGITHRINTEYVFIRTIRRIENILIRFCTTLCMSTAICAMQQV
jgi:hypothetical protein